MITRRSFLIGVAVVGLGGCGGDDNGDDDGPPAISYGSETCDRCNMVISEERHAAALKGDDEWLAFDDCGEMIAYAQENAMTDRTAWVHDYEQLTWVPARDAHYVWLPNRTTPMATGIIAYADKERAEAKVAETGGWSKNWSATVADWSMS